MDKPGGLIILLTLGVSPVGKANLPSPDPGGVVQTSFI